MKKLPTIRFTVIAVVVIAMLAAKFWENYSRRVLDLDMDMCDKNGNVIHVTVDAVQYRKRGGSWEFRGEIRFDGKVFTNEKYEGDRLVTTEFKNSGEWSSWPVEWISSFSVAGREGGTYYFMVYQQRGERENPWQANEDNTFHYFGPASTKEEAERICDMWVQKN